MVEGTWGSDPSEWQIISAGTKDITFVFDPEVSIHRFENRADSVIIEGNNAWIQYWAVYQDSITTIKNIKSQCADATAPMPET